MDNKDFDFEKIGKQTPYTTPIGFYGEMQNEVFEKIKAKQHKNWVIRASISTIAVAAILSGIVFLPARQASTAPAAQQNESISVNNHYAHNDDKWIEALSDEDLESLVSLSENDEFLK